MRGLGHLGHSNITITQRYIHTTDDRKKAAVELLEGKQEKAQKGENLLHICTAEDQDKNEFTKNPVNH